jgi:aconitate decarboxylase
MRTATTDNPHTTQIAEFVAGLRPEMVPAEVREHARWDILDSIGCAVFGQGLPIAEILTAALRPVACGGNVPIWGTTWRTSPDTAALVNGTLVHSYEMDDLHAEAIIHPGGVTLPAVLALAGAAGATGAEVVTAHVAGLEVSTRAGLAVGVAMLSRGWHNNGVLGALAASAGGASVLRLTPDQARNAIGTAGSLAAGLMAAQYGAMVKRMHAGHAAQTGVRSALLAREGFTGIQALFEEPYGGYLSAFTGVTEAPDLSADFGTRWETLRVGFKPYAACGSSHTTIDVLLDLRERHGLRAEDIESVDVRSSSVTKDHVGWDYHPDSVTTAQMNLAFAAASAVIFGQVSVAEFQPDRLARADILALTGKVRVTADPEIDADGRTHRHEVEVTVRRTDGEVLTGQRVSATGSARHPMTPARREQKFLSLTEPRLGAGQARELFERVMDLDEAADVTGLESCLARATAAAPSGGIGPR